MPSSSDTSSRYTSTAQSGPSGPFLLMQHSHPTLVFKPLILFTSTSYLLPHHHFMLLAVPLYLLLSLPLLNLLRVLQWNTWGLRARRTELLHFILSYPVDLICIQESNLNLSSSFSALRSDSTHSRSGIFSTDVTDASGSVIIFVRQGLSFSELSNAFLSSLDPNSDYVEVNISLKDSSLHSFFNVYASLFAFLRRIAEPISFLPPFFPPMLKRKRWNFHAFASTEKAPLPLPLPLPHPCSKPSVLHIFTR